MVWFAFPFQIILSAALIIKIFVIFFSFYYYFYFFTENSFFSYNILYGFPFANSSQVPTSPTQIYTFFFLIIRKQTSKNKNKRIRVGQNKKIEKKNPQETGTDGETYILTHRKPIKINSETIMICLVLTICCWA